MLDRQIYSGINIILAVNATFSASDRIATVLPCAIEPDPKPIELNKRIPVDSNGFWTRSVFGWKSSPAAWRNDAEKMVICRLNPLGVYKAAVYVLSVGRATVEVKWIS